MSNLWFPTSMFDRLGRSLFEAMGASVQHAKMVNDHLIESSLMGVDSHGVCRYVFYYEEYQRGLLKPSSPVVIDRDTANTAIVDVGGNFGQVCGYRMTELAIEKARKHGVSCILSRRAHHVGRLGAYTEYVARESLVGIATTCSAKTGHFVAPWGGKAGRLATNPIAWAAPTSHNIIALDASTSAIAEGRIRMLLNQGEQLPSDCVLNADGQVTQDPKEFYGPPRGVILPFGGIWGHRSFGLSLLTVVLGQVLSGQVVHDQGEYLNAMSLIALNPEVFETREGFIQRMDDMAAYIKDTPASDGFDAVHLPGEGSAARLKLRREKGIPLPAETWNEIKQVAGQLNVKVESDAD